MKYTPLTCMKRVLGTPALAAVLLTASGNTLAAPIIFTDLTLTGLVELSTTIGVAPFSDGNVTQSGAITTTEGGGTTSNAFSTSPGVADGVDDSTTSLPASNPLTGTFTDTGDGIGYSTNLDALFETGFNFNEGFDFITAFGINLANTSVYSTFTITMQVDYSNIVDVAGVDAFADSRLDLEVDVIDVFSSEVLSDSLLGDELNGTPTGTFGNLISDSGSFSFDVIIAPGFTSIVGGTHQWEGGVFVTGSSLVDIGVDLTIANVTCSGTCNVVPLPGAALLFASGLSGLALFRRRRTLRVAA
ncbi:MAG: VPLPA-CTERM sorting domain-containing protein [Gammaproteobacteria bacterium]